MVNTNVTINPRVTYFDPRTGLLTREGTLLFAALNDLVNALNTTLIEEGITNGNTAQAPSSNAVYDALALKATTAALTAGLATKQDLDADLTAIAALVTTAYGRALLTLADLTALLTLIGAASLTAQGVVELATAAETLAGTDATRAITPAGLKGATATYTPTWTGTGGTPSLGDGTLSAEYMVGGGGLVTATIQLTFGSTTNVTGITVWNFTLPVTAANTFYTGAVYALDTGTANHIGIAQMSSTTTIRFIGEATNIYGAAVPHTWAAGDVLQATITYRAA